MFLIAIQAMREARRCVSIIVNVPWPHRSKTRIWFILGRDLLASVTTVLSSRLSRASSSRILPKAMSAREIVRYAVLNSCWASVLS